MTKSLTDWLDTIRTSHSVIIDYSLNRIQTVAIHLDLLQPNAPVITVTGTNGKGSTVHTMEAILKAADYRVGVFTSPHLDSYNEQIRINGNWVSDEQLVAAFTLIHNACTSMTISLTEFEFLTLAALLIFKQQSLNIIILEVGLGGDNDAVAIIKSDITVITSLALDHQEYLGDTVDAIALNEAQLLPAHKIGIIGVKNPPQVLIDHAKKINAQLCYIDRDFYAECQPDCWSFKNNSITYSTLPYPKVLVRNAALAIQALLSAHIIFSHEQLCQGLQQINISGRLQFIQGSPDYLIDVSHNIEGVTQLGTHLEKFKHKKIIAVFSAFSDKPIAELITLIDPFVTQWVIAPIDHPRAASINQLIHAFGNKETTLCQNLNEAFKMAVDMAKPDDLILAFGSFFVAREALSFADPLSRRK